MPKMNFEKIIESGQNPKGFTAQTANGTAHWDGTGWNRDDQQYERPQAEKGGPWQGGRSNRTGE